MSVVESSTRTKLVALFHCLLVGSCAQAKRKRFTPAKSAAAESGLVRFTTLLEDTPSAKLAKLVENPLYTSTNMTTIKNYLKMKVPAHHCAGVFMCTH